jgi:hypothetical protein
MDLAISAVRSVELSTTIISPSTPLASKKDRAFSMHVFIVDSSFMEGITMETLGMHPHITYHYIIFVISSYDKYSFDPAAHFLEL